MTTAHGGGIDVERLTRALHEANVDCDYSRKFDRKSCEPDDGPHSILAHSIAVAYERDAPAPLPACTYRGCGKPENDPVHPRPDERMGVGRHVYRCEIAA